jgi:hypothetical protein
MADEAIDLKAIAAVAAAMKAEGQGIPVEVMSEPSKTADLERQLGLTGRAAAQGAAGLVGLAYDPIAAVQNYLFGTETQPLREQVKRALTDLGVPEPETATERVIGAISEGAVGAGGQAAIARGAERVLTTGAQRVAGQLAAQPGAQAAAGGTGGGAAQAVAEAGGGPGAQLAAGLAGGVAGGRAAGVRMEAPSAALPAAVREAEDAGVRVMTTDVRQPTTFAGRWLQRTGEMIPMAGTGGPRAAQQQERIDASVDLLRNYGVTEASAADNTIISNVAKDLLARRGENLTKYTGMKTDVIERLSQPNTTVPVAKSVAKIDEEIARLNKISPTQFKPVVDRLMTWRDDLTGTREVALPNGQTQTVVQGQPLATIEVLRKQIGEAFTDPSLAAVRSEGEKVLSRIYAPLREDMADYIKANGQRRDFDKWNIANKQLASMAGELELGAMKAALAKGDTSPEVIRTMLFSAKPSDIKALYRGLSAEGKRNARTAVLQEAFNKVGGNFENLSPDQFKRQLIRLGSPIGVFFSGQDLKAVEGLTRALKMTEQAGRAGVSPPTGVQAVPVVGAAVLTDILGGAGAGIVGGATIGGIARLYESAPVRNILLKLPQTTKGSPQEQELIKQLTVALRAEKAAEEPPQAAPQ